MEGADGFNLNDYETDITDIDVETTFPTGGTRLLTWNIKTFNASGDTLSLLTFGQEKCRILQAEGIHHPPPDNLAVTIVLGRQRMRVKDGDTLMSYINELTSGSVVIEKRQ